MNESTDQTELTERITRLLPKVQRIARRYSAVVDADDLTQEGVLAILKAPDDHTDAWYLTCAKWEMLHALRSPRYRNPSPDQVRPERHTAPSADAAASSAILGDLSPEAQLVAVLRWSGMTAAECRRLAGRYPYERGRDELVAYLTPTDE